jgi:hypothetical protein
MIAAYTLPLPRQWLNVVVPGQLYIYRALLGSHNTHEFLDTWGIAIVNGGEHLAQHGDIPRPVCTHPRFLFLESNVLGMVRSQTKRM